MNGIYNRSFREELVATAILMGVVVTGSFAVAFKTLQKTAELPPGAGEQVLGATKNNDEAEIERLVREILNSPTPVAKSTATPLPAPAMTAVTSPLGSSSATPRPTYNNTIIEQPYGNGGEYDNADYRLVIANPRLVVSDSRIFKVDITLANKRIEAGMRNRLSATIVKEGAVIAESVPFSLSQSAIAYPGEQLTYTASMSLIAGTDVARLKYLPMIESVVDTVHDL